MTFFGSKNNETDVGNANEWTHSWVHSSIYVSIMVVDSVANLVSEILDLVSPKYFGMT